MSIQVNVAATYYGAAVGTLGLVACRQSVFVGIVALLFLFTREIIRFAQFALFASMTVVFYELESCRMHA